MNTEPGIRFCGYFPTWPTGRRSRLIDEERTVFSIPNSLSSAQLHRFRRGAGPRKAHRGISRRRLRARLSVRRKVRAPSLWTSVHFVRSRPNVRRHHRLPSLRRHRRNESHGSASGASKCEPTNSAEAPSFRNLPSPVPNGSVTWYFRDTRGARCAKARAALRRSQSLPP